MDLSKKSFLIIGINITLTALPVMYTGSVEAEAEENSPASNGVSTLIAERAAQMPATTHNMRVYRDPQTGQLGQLPASVALPRLTVSERRMLSRSDQGLLSRTLTSGAVAIDLQGRYRNMSMATLGHDGQATVNCAITPAEAAAVLKGGQ